MANTKSTTPIQASGDHSFESTLNAYLDGELSLEKQSDLFSHLAKCDRCRSLMDSVLQFRRISRLEYISVPPSVDDSFFERLARLKENNDRFDRSEDRQPLWNTRRSVSVRSAMAAVVSVFLIGLLLPMSGGSGNSSPNVQFIEERVVFEDRAPIVRESPIYVFVPGLTVEADRADASEPY